jgi:hypothetical protein
MRGTNGKIGFRHSARTAHLAGDVVGTGRAFRVRIMGRECQGFGIGRKVLGTLPADQ